MSNKKKLRLVKFGVFFQSINQFKKVMPVPSTISLFNPITLQTISIQATFIHTHTIMTTKLDPIHLKITDLKSS